VGSMKLPASWLRRSSGRGPTPPTSSVRSTTSTKPLADVSRVSSSRSACVREAVAESEVDSTAADEELLVTNAAVLPPVPALVQLLLATLAL
jgi:hypothetical protein